MDKLNKKVIIPVVICVLLLIGGIITYYYLNSFSVEGERPFESSRLNILVTGSDIPIDGPARADTIFVASIDMETGDSGVLFVPRDTPVEIPNYGTYKLNTSYALGGVELVEETLENFLEIPIDYYVDLDFEGFSRMVDILGGVEIEVENDLYYRDEAAGLEIDISEGKQLLDGKEALEYVRYRERTHGDIGRIDRQQKFIESVFKQIMSPEIITKLPSLFSEFRQHVETNIPFRDFTPFANLLRKMDIHQIELRTLPGTPEYIEGISYWIPHQDQVEALVDSLIRSKEFLDNKQYKIRIYNGNGVQGAAGKAGELLEKYGLSITGLANADHFNYEKTEIKYYESDKKDVAARIEDIIGGEKRQLQREGDEAGVDIRIILGQDFVSGESEET